MSTKALHEALEWLENYLDHNPEAQDARRRAHTELEAIERAATDIYYHGVAALRVEETGGLMTRIAKERK